MTNSLEALGQTMAKYAEKCENSETAKSICSRAKVADARYEETSARRQMEAADLDKEDADPTIARIHTGSTQIEVALAVFCMDWYQNSSGYRMVSSVAQNSETAAMFKCLMDKCLDETRSKQEVEDAFFWFLNHPFVAMGTHVSVENWIESRRVIDEDGAMAGIEDVLMEAERFYIRAIPCYRFFVGNYNIAGVQNQEMVVVRHWMTTARFKNFGWTIPQDIRPKRHEAPYAYKGGGIDEGYWVREHWIDYYPGHEIEPLLRDILTEKSLIQLDHRQKICIWHCDGKVLEILPNYQRDKNQYPFEAASCFPRRMGFGGVSWFERGADLDYSVEEMLNILFDNMIENAMPTIITSPNSGLDANLYRKARRSRSRVIVSGTGGGNINDKISYPPIPDASAIAFPLLDRYGVMQDLTGINKVTQGSPSSGATATEVSIATQSSGARNSRPFRNFSQRVLRPILNNVKDMIALFLSSPRAVAYMGENGQQVYQSVTAEMAAGLDYYDIHTSFSWEFGRSKENATFMLNMIRVLGPFLAERAPEMAVEMAHIAMLNQDMPPDEVQKAILKAGVFTTPAAEIAALLANPQVNPIVRQDDNHQAALSMLEARIAAMPPEQQQEIMARENVQSYYQQRMAFLEQQMMMMQMEQAMQQQMAMAEDQGGGNREADRQNQTGNGVGPTTDKGRRLSQAGAMNVRGGASAIGAVGRGA